MRDVFDKPSERADLTHQQKGFHMKVITLILAGLIISGQVFAREFKAAQCRSEAIKGAKALFVLNNKEKGKVSLTSSLIDMNNTEGGFEIWDIEFIKNGIKFSPYRMYLSIDDCTITNFQLIAAG